MGHTGNLCKIQRQKWSSSHYTLKVSIGHEVLWQLIHIVVDLLAHPGVGSWPGVEVFCNSWTFFFSFSESWSRCLHSTMAPISTWIIKAVGGKRQMHSLVYLQGIFVGAVLSLFTPTSCSALLWIYTIFRSNPETKGQHFLQLSQFH